MPWALKNNNNNYYYYSCCCKLMSSSHDRQVRSVFSKSLSEQRSFKPRWKIVWCRPSQAWNKLPASMRLTGFRVIWVLLLGTNYNSLTYFLTYLLRISVQVIFILHVVYIGFSWFGIPYNDVSPSSACAALHPGKQLSVRLLLLNITTIKNAKFNPTPANVKN